MHLTETNQGPRCRGCVLKFDARIIGFSLKHGLMGFSSSFLEVNAHVLTLKTLCKRKALNPEEADALVTKWVHQILTKALRIIQVYLSDEPEVSIENAFVTPTASVSKNGKRAVALSRWLCQAITAVYTIGSWVIICPSIDLKEIIPVLLSIITSRSPELRPNGLPGSTASLKQKAPSLFIQAWLTMGKICLADGKLAKGYMPLFLQVFEAKAPLLAYNSLVEAVFALNDCHHAHMGHGSSHNSRVENRLFCIR
ncbi:hypothetical protein Nepgr_013723 [Nepenthes gracilis]|uniref:Uncharacterized protein n=1 Tax=Nepenthes gracilis TaxID=150966 RepID=A0AAD3SJR9_NEPGR|nr:hypothetical protein Nepgr_013723 [Nepenthes gracilis]